VSIAETAQSNSTHANDQMSARSVLGCWDNSTRGLDSSSALEFAQALRLTTNLLRTAEVVAIYQAGERVYEGNTSKNGLTDSVRQGDSSLRGSSNLFWPN
jgi:ABC-type multidrug transport system ATPase subunit